MWQLLLIVEQNLLSIMVWWLWISSHFFHGENSSQIEYIWHQIGCLPDVLSHTPVSSWQVSSCCVIGGERLWQCHQSSQSCLQQTGGWQWEETICCLLQRSHFSRWRQECGDCRVDWNHQINGSWNLHISFWHSSKHIQSKV